jgi:threonine aldolase
MTSTAAIDLRSDTVTRPTAAMRRAMADAEVGDDERDGDPTTGRLESVVAERLGKEACRFFPSGTMANQAAIWALTTPGTEIYADANSHIVQWEMAGAAALSGVQIRTVHGAGLAMRAADLRAAIHFPSGGAADASLVCVENTHNGGGGAVTPLAALRELNDVARELRLPMHLDGARLWNASAASGTSLADFAACTDTVMVSFTKALGAPVGSALAGPADVIARAKSARRRFGGDLRQSGVLAAAALYGLEHHLARIPEDHEAARHLASVVDGIGGAKVVPPDSNIVMIDLPTPRAAAVAARAAELGVLVSVWTPSRLRAVTHLDAPMELVVVAARKIAQALELSTES